MTLQILFRLLVVSAGLFAKAAVNAGQPVALQAGVASADITPDPKMLNWTVAIPKPYGAVHDPIFVRALVLSDGQAKVAILVWDLLDAREYAVSRVRAAITRGTGIP